MCVCDDGTRLGRVGTGRVGMGIDGSGRVGTGRDGTGRVYTGLYRTGRVRSGRDVAPSTPVHTCHTWPTPSTPIQTRPHSHTRLDTLYVVKSQAILKPPLNKGVSSASYKNDFKSRLARPANMHATSESAERRATTRNPIGRRWSSSKGRLWRSSRRIRVRRTTSMASSTDLCPAQKSGQRTRRTPYNVSTYSTTCTNRGLEAPFGKCFVLLYCILFVPLFPTPYHNHRTEAKSSRYNVHTLNWPRPHDYL